MKTKIIVVGGFLGAGKTTLLWNMAKKFAEQGKKVGLISNDQASELVDTAFLEESGGTTVEVHGSCFCCNYNGFVNAIEELQNENQVDIIIAEPVGSCTDLSATIMQPLKDLQKKDIEVAPLSVLIDPERLRELLLKENCSMHESAMYILLKQIEEADYIVINKIDLLEKEDLETLILNTSKKWEYANVEAISGLTCLNMDSWMNDILTDTKAGTHILEIDYDVYAEGEAVLGWLNAKVQLSGENIDWNYFTENFLWNFKSRFEEENAEIGHIKMIMKEKNNFLLGNLTCGMNNISVRGHVDQAIKIKMTLNARVEMQPEHLECIIRESLETEKKNGIQSEIEVLNCLKPGRPDPTYRYRTVVE